MPGSIRRLEEVALALSLASLFSCGITAVPGLLCGVLALMLARRYQCPLGQTKLAMAAVAVACVTGLVALVVWSAYGALAKTSSCYINLGQVGLAVAMYQSDHEEHVPLGANWCDAAMWYTHNDRVLTCPVYKGGRGGYAYNGHLAGLGTGDLTAPEDTVLAFDGTGGWNAIGGPESVAPRHRSCLRVGPGSWNLVFADGHRKPLGSQKPEDFRWEP